MELLVDLHTHTVSSGHAYSTITENALAASRRGLKLLGMTDQLSSTLYPRESRRGECLGKLDRQSKCDGISGEWRRSGFSGAEQRALVKND